jgi:uncharacterized membrane protein YqiK
VQCLIIIIIIIVIIIIIIIGARHVLHMGERRVLVGNPERKRPLGRPRCRWEDNIKMNLQEVECGDIDWIDLAQDRDSWREIVNVVMKLRVP